MKTSDKFADEYLKQQGFKRIVYEPHGNVPPDFLVHDRIAVEARRLNQNKETRNRLQGLEELWKPLQTTVQAVLKTMGPAVAGSSWFVQYSFRRPLPERKELMKLLANALRELKDAPQQQLGKIRVSDNFTLTFHLASKVQSELFVFGSCTDCDYGGFVMSEMIRNLKLCIAEKTRKAARYRHKYPEWWLLFHDLIGYGDWNQSERQQLRECVQFDGSWDKIIIVNPSDYADSLEISPAAVK